MYNYGIMQGRLTEPKGRGIQFFPFDNWEQEFYLAKKLGLNEIEFIFDYEKYELNPLWSQYGQEKLRKIIAETNVQVHSVCFDYFMRRAFFKKEDTERQKLRSENKQILLHVLNTMSEMGIDLIEIPLVDNSSLTNNSDKEAFREFIIEIISHTDSTIKIGLETDLPPESFDAYLNSIHADRIGANYDSGNSSGLGYNMYKEVTILGNRIFNIHIKDRLLRGTTVALGTGNADFSGLFTGLKEIGYKGSFVLQAARGEDGRETENIAKQIKFVKEYVKQYLE
ncbi:MAG: sugar phosphate isomerase/epimerase [Clostridium sp.]|nr:sugar phosphate isomerase/epimerase [Clostridium sp.]